jgi:peptidoglycan/LPS O-acetylase OafA/YrhL
VGLSLHRDGAGSAHERRLPYQPALDGIRALAVAAVLAYHAGMPWARGGFLGVDAFFVLSGFLITSLLLVEYRAKGRIAFTAFWARRGRRLLPALFLMLIGVGVYAVAFAKPDELNRLRADALTTIGYVANWRPVFSGESYFDQFSVPSPLRHTWSLAIEEQWYAVWPLLLFVLLRLRRGSLRVALTVSLAMAAGSALLMALLFQPLHDPSRVFYGTDTRAQSLLVGALLAMLLLERAPVRSAPGKAALQAGAVLCVVFLGFVWARAGDGSALLYRGGFLVLGMAVAVVIAASVQPAGGVVGRVLALPPLRGLGLISYGVYLWHWPVYLMLTPDRTGLNGYPLFALRVATTLGVAIASYQFLEMPVRRGAFKHWKASWTLAPAAAGCVAVALVLVTRGGAPTFSASTLASSDFPPTAPASAAIASAPTPAAPAPAATATPAGPVRVLIIGDSVAVTLSDGLERAQAQWDLAVWNQSVLGCGLVGADAKLFQGKWVEQGTECGDWRARWQSDVDTFGPDVVLVLSGAWDTYDMNVDGRALQFGAADADAYALAGLEEAVDVLSSRGATVILLTTPYPEKRDLAVDGRTNRVDPKRVDVLNGLYRKVAEQRPGEATVVDLNGYLTSLGNPVTLDGVDLRIDDLHFTPEGSDVIVRWLAPQIVGIARGTGGTP